MSQEPRGIPRPDRDAPPSRPAAASAGLRCVSGDPVALCGVSNALTIECPHCGETFSLAFDVSEGSAEFVIDCEICCRPMTVAVRVEDGAVDGVEIAEC